MSGSSREAEAQAGWTDVVRDQAPVLHALGYALTGSADDAEALLEAALAELAVGWDGPDDPQHALTVSCRALVARHQRGGALERGSLGERVVVTQPPPTHHDADLERRLPAWQRLQELDPADRAALVVRALAPVRHLDHARVLGVPRRDLPQVERRAEEAFGPGLAELPAALAAVTGQLPPVVVDPDGAARLAAPRRRRRTVWTVVGLVAVLAAVAAIGAVVLTPDDPGPSTPPALDLAPLVAERGDVALGELPDGGPTDVPYWASGLLHVGDREYRTVVPRDLERAGDTVLVSGAGRWQVVSAGVISSLPGGITSVRLAPDGAMVAWVAVQQVVAVTVGSDGVLGEPVTFDAGELAAPDEVVRIQSVLADGRVVVQVAETPIGSEVDTGSSGRAVVWTPGEDGAEEVELPSDVLLDFDPAPWPGGIVWRVPELGVVLAEVDEDGAARPVGEVASGSGVWDADGKVMAVARRGLPLVQSPFAGGSSESALPLPRPRFGSWEVAGWETGGSVVVALALVSTAPPVVVRCSVPALECERVAGGPDGPAIFPG